MTTKADKTVYANEECHEIEKRWYAFSQDKAPHDALDVIMLRSLAHDVSLLAAYVKHLLEHS